MTDSTPGLSEPPALIMRAPQAPNPNGSAVQRLPYSHGKRAGYGILWATWTVFLSIAGFTGLFSGQILAGLVALMLAALAGGYDYRIWTWQARRLLFLLIW